jgi:hypothetical protein
MDFICILEPGGWIQSAPAHGAGGWKPVHGAKP